MEAQVQAWDEIKERLTEDLSSLSPAERLALLEKFASTQGEFFEISSALPLMNSDKL